MTQTTDRLNLLSRALKERRAVKVIAGIANDNPEIVLDVVQTANTTGATAVDVSATPAIVRMVRQATHLPVFASSIEPYELKQAVELGADVAELGNYDALYAKGIFITAEEVLEKTRTTLELLQGSAPLSVTIPGHLSKEAQIRMVKTLEQLGVNIIQTEGATRALNQEPKTATLSAEQKAAQTLDNTRTLAQYTQLPLMTASGISAGNIQDAFAAGASAVGIGSAVNKQKTPDAMQETLKAIMAQVTSLVTEVYQAS